MQKLRAWRDRLRNPPPKPKTIPSMPGTTPIFDGEEMGVERMEEGGEEGEGKVEVETNGIEKVDTKVSNILHLHF